MNKSTTAEIDVSAILNTYVYMDEQSDAYSQKTLSEIMDLMPETVKNSSDYKAVLNAINNENSNIGSLRLVSQSMQEGFGDNLIVACAFQDDSGNTYVAYRGTGDGKWVDNGIGIATKSSPMQEESHRYFDHVVKSLNLDSQKDGKLIVTGHSKGGNEAQYVTLNSKYGDLIDNCYSIDGQGFSKEAIQMFKDKYGEEHYLDQLKKMYSINGENDYVHDLGCVVIPEDNTCFIETPNVKDFGGYHDIEKMLDETGKLNWTIDDETKEITKGQQGPIGELAKALSEKMRELDQEDLEDCAITIMSMIEYLMPYNDELGGEYLVGTANGEFMTAEEFIGFLAHGIPLLSETLFQTEEGKAILVDLINDGVEKIKEKYGIMGIAGASFIVSTLLPKICKFVGGVNFIARVLDGFTDFIDDVKNISKKIKTWYLNLKSSFISTINKWNDWFNRNFNQGYKQAVQSTYIKVDTNTLRYHANRLSNVNRRIANLDKRMDALYTKVGLFDLWDLLQADVLTGYSWRLSRCINYLNDTANEFDAVERSISSQV